MRKIAIIGGGYNGLAVASTMIRLLRKNKKFASITVFDTKGMRGGRIFAADLANNFRLNHEASNMGAVNAFSNSVEYDDFYKWIQKYKDKTLDSLNGSTLKEFYKDHDLENPMAYLPRSLYGHYLEYRLSEMQQNCSSNFHTFTYEVTKVKNITKNGQKYILEKDHGDDVFDGVVLATGFWYHKRDTSDLVYTSSSKLPTSLTAKIGIIGTSLSAIEVALSLVDKGYTNITLYSRNGRLPKVRGKYNEQYQLQFLSHGIFETLHNKFGFLQQHLLLELIKKEFDYAYFGRGKGLYQEKGINWQEIFQNNNPLMQLDEDIASVESGEELYWRSVLMKMYDFESELWRGLSASNRKMFLQHFSSLLLSFVAPMPLVQAKKLRQCLQNGFITVKGQLRSHKKVKDSWYFDVNGKEESKEFLIDARGPAKDIRHNRFIMNLVADGFLEVNVAGGVKVNPRFQAIVKNKPRHNVYVIGPLVYGERPHNSTTFGHDYSHILASYIVNSIQTHETEYRLTQPVFDPSWLQPAMS